MIKDLWKYSGKYKIDLAMIPVAVLVGTVMEIWIPYLMGDMLDKGLDKMAMDVVVHEGILMIIASIVLVVSGFMESFFVAKWSTGFTRNMRDQLFAKLQELPHADTDEYGSASILTRMSTDMNFIKKALGMYNSLMRCPLMILCTIIMTIRVYPSVSWLFVGVAVLFVGIMVFIVRAAIKHYNLMFLNYDELNNVLKENVTAERTVKAFAREKHEEERFNKRADDLRHESFISEGITVMNEPLLHLVMNICTLVITFVGGKLIIARNMEVGDFFCIVSYVNQILVQIYIVALIMVPILSATISLKRIFEIVKRKPSIEDSGKDDVRPEDGSVRFENVQFGYYEDKEKRVLHDLNMDIKSGEFVGVIGSSGCGKSSLINLIPRFYDTSEGDIIVGGNSIRDMSLAQLRQSIGLVPQSSLLFTGTIRENLLWGNENATEEEMIKACKVADAYGFISTFPDGFETVIGQGGSTVSGGQRQRLCIARALLRNPKILIFDDSLSAVDNTTEENIVRELSENYSDTTVILVTQRFTSVQKADRIIVMNEGCIDKVGTHDELLTSSKIYKEIYETQRRMID
ncbi:MAG: ABC transporter ATP-binding protein/permease [Eubacterium sp.]|nr:ABC transporter ATP-binding protein/permease [Eubacterium sp.]